MSNKPFTVYPGKFICKTCKKDVFSMRLWHETGLASWMCSDKHVSEVQMVQLKYKKKKDYERKE